MERLTQIECNFLFCLRRPDIAADLLKDEVGRNEILSVPSPGLVELPKVDESIVIVRVTHVSGEHL